MGNEKAKKWGEDRKKTNEKHGHTPKQPQRERNVGHPKAEEHNLSTTRGNRRGARK